MFKIIKNGLFVYLLFHLPFLQAQNIPYLSKNKYGIADLNGNLKFTPAFDSLQYTESLTFRKPSASFYTFLNGKKGFINESAKEILKPVYEDVTIKDSFITVRKNHQAGIVNLNGLILIPAQYDNIEISFGYAIVTKGIKKGIAYLTRTKGVVLKNPEFDEVHADTENGTPYFICITGQTLKIFTSFPEKTPVKLTEQPLEKYPCIKELYLLKSSECDGMRIIYQTVSKKQEMDGDNTPQTFEFKFYEKFPNEYDQYVYVRQWKDGFRIHKDSAYFKVIYEYKNGYWGMIDTKGNIIIPHEYEHINLSNYSFIATQQFLLKKNGKWGVLAHSNRYSITDYDSTSKVLVPFVYDTIVPYGGYYLLKQNDLYGFLDKTNEKIVSPEFKSIKYFENYEIEKDEWLGVYWVLTKDDKWVYIREDGLKYYKE